MIVECADRTFGGVAEVSVWRDKLEINFVFVEGFLHCVGALVVEVVERRRCTMLT